MELCWLKCCLACPLTHFPASVLVTNSVSVKLNTQAALVSSVDGWSDLLQSIYGPLSCRGGQ